MAALHVLGGIFPSAVAPHAPNPTRSCLSRPSALSSLGKRNDSQSSFVSCQSDGPGISRSHLSGSLPSRSSRTAKLGTAPAKLVEPLTGKARTVDGFDGRCALLPSNLSGSSFFQTSSRKSGRPYGPWRRQQRGPDRRGTARCRAPNGDPFGEEEIGAEHGEGFATFRSRGPLHVDVDFLNDRMKTRGLQRIRYAMKPDEAFGLIYSLDNVLADTRALRVEAWRRLAVEEGRDPGQVDDAQRQLQGVGAERAVRQVLTWTQQEDEVQRLASRLTEIYCVLFAQVRTPMEGVKEWLRALHTARVPCAVSSSLDRLTLLAALDRMGLSNYFTACVTEEDGMESIAHRFLSAAVKLDRPPAKCVVFEDDPRGIAAAHNCSMKAVALIGAHPAYELTQADLAVGSFSELSVINLRRLFAARGTEFMDLQKQLEDKKPPKRRLRIDTL